MRVPNSRTTLLLACGLLAALPAGAGVEFAKVKPILNEHCIQCHGGVKKKGGLSFISVEGFVREGKSGKAAVVPGKPEESHLMHKITAEDPDERMPPEAPLTLEQTAALREWIAGGASWPVHWSFAPVRRSLPLAAGFREGNAVDGFVRRGLEASGLTPAEEADRRTLIRRLYLDLLGLLPDPDVVEGFQEDRRPDAWERLVARVLASPHFGERWGRHWLDQARYADSDGYEKDNPRDKAWTYRQWVIDEVNADLSFDQFSVQQIAGDLLPDSGPWQRLATGFHRQTLVNTEGGTDKEEDRTKRVIDRVRTTGMIWMGLTVECTQCHDHPYDPATQEEFYKFYAFFNNTDEADVEVTAAGENVKAPVMRERDKDRRTTYLFHRGDFLQPSRELGPVEAGTHAALPAIKNARNRLDLARWLFDPGHPLTARVTVNTIWSHLFGAGLSTTLEDFGSRGDAPSHPELLDWLAHTFSHELRWSRKELIRLIVSSSTYRQSSRIRERGEQCDPDNRLLHRQNRFRVEAEIIRDLHLHASGLLVNRIGGPSVFPPLAKGIAKQSYANSFKWTTSKGGDRYRRGVYTFFKRTAPDPNLIMFDCPDSNLSRSGRGLSNTPIQALTTLHNEVFVEAAGEMARRLQRGGHLATGDWPGRLYELCLSRRPSAAETEVLRGLYRDSFAWYRDNPIDARFFARTDESEVQMAALIATARIVMNLDEFVTRE